MTGLRPWFWLRKPQWRATGCAPWRGSVSGASAGVARPYHGLRARARRAEASVPARPTTADIDLFELNEAFAAQVLACLQGLGIAANDPRVNPNGGAIALGHPLGMSGARITGSAALELSLRTARRAVVSMCVGVGQGVALLLERV